MLNIFESAFIADRAQHIKKWIQNLWLDAWKNRLDTLFIFRFLSCRCKTQHLITPGIYIYFVWLYVRVRVMASLLTNKYLHKEIREKGGAYGGGATAATAGHMSFYSYRYGKIGFLTILLILCSICWLLIFVVLDLMGRYFWQRSKLLEDHRYNYVISWLAGTRKLYSERCWWSYYNSLPKGSVTSDIWW